MSLGGERARTASNSILRPNLLLSAALAALIVAAPAGDRTSALAMELGSSLGAARFNSGPQINSGPQVFVPRGSFGRPSIGNGREIGVLGHVDPGGLPGGLCKQGR